VPSYKEDFGQTLGYWGLPAGPYFVMPILGASSARDTVGFAGDIVVDPFFSLEEDQIYWGFVVLRAIDKRAGLLAAGDLVSDAALDRYIFVRDAYLQRRESLVHDGDPPAVDDDDFFWDEDAIDE
jgi:phospholipid-binding lipoprotein MlaA